MSIWLYFKNILMVTSFKWIKSKWLLLPGYLHAVVLLLLLKWKMWVLPPPLHLNSQTATLTLCCHIAAMKALLIPFHVHFLAFISVFVSTPVIKVQIVLPRLLSHHMAWWECGVWLKALIFEVIVPRVSRVLLRCCSSSFISLICSGFQENYHPPRWRQFVWRDSAAACSRSAPSNVACVSEWNVRSECSGTDGFLMVYHAIHL